MRLYFRGGFSQSRFFRSPGVFDDLGWAFLAEVFFKILVSLFQDVGGAFPLIALATFLFHQAIFKFLRLNTFPQDQGRTF